MNDIKFKFKVKDNWGTIHESKEYSLWDIINNDDCLSNEQILEDMERTCNCTNESISICECEPEFDAGEIVEIEQVL